MNTIPANDEFNKVTEIELDNTLSTKSEEILNSPAKEWSEEFETLKAGIIQYVVDLSFGEKNKAGSRENMEKALDLLFTIHSAHLVERIEKKKELYKSALAKAKGEPITEQILEMQIVALDQAIDIIKDN